MVCGPLAAVAPRPPACACCSRTFNDAEAQQQVTTEKLRQERMQAFLLAREPRAHTLKGKVWEKRALMNTARTVAPVECRGGIGPGH